jgi:4-hydroxybenzoyl-CoA thioesterase
VFTHVHNLTVEFGDCDPAGLVFYPRFFAMFDAATAYLLEAASGLNRAALTREQQILGWPIVDTRAVFHHPVTYDEKVAIESRIVHVGRCSLKIEHKLSRALTLCAECSEVRVWTRRDPTDLQLIAVPIEHSLRKRLLDD